jgi:hypothetical protein
MIEQLTPEQIDDLDNLLQFWVDKYPPKYTDGAIEHDGFLGDLHVMQFAQESVKEVLDLMSYLPHWLWRTEELIKENNSLKEEIRKLKNE